MKSKEEVLNNALIVLNKPDKPWEVTIANDSIVVKWKWMDATFFSPNEITNEVKEYSYIVTLTDKGKWTEKDITSETEKNINIGEGKLEFGSSNFSGHTVSKSITIGFGKNNDSNESGIVRFKYDTSIIKNEIKNYLQECGYKKKGLFF